MLSNSIIKIFYLQKKLKKLSLFNNFQNKENKIE